MRLTPHNPCSLSILFNVVLVSWCEQKNLVLASADNQVKVVEHIAPKDAEIRGSWVYKTRKLSVYPCWSTVIADQLHDSRYAYKSTCPTDPIPLRVKSG